MAKSRKPTPAARPRRLLLGNSDALVSEIKKRNKGGPSALPGDYDESRSRIINDVQASLSKLRELPANQRVDDELVLCLRLHPDMLAKSYEPVELFQRVPDLSLTGSRPWNVAIDTVRETDRTKKLLSKSETVAQSRMLFVRSTETGFQRLVQELNRSPQQLTEEFKDDIRKIEKIDLLTSDERLHGFTGWKEGRVELIFHPSRRTLDGQREFLFELFDQRGINLEQARIVPYSNGPTFVSVRLNQRSLEVLRQCNPLRAAHPLATIDIPNLRAVSTLAVPASPIGNERSVIKIGMFDGGVDTSQQPALRPFVEEDIERSIGTPADRRCLDHGTAVAGALLYGSLDRYEPERPLPTPRVSVVSFRVLPTSDPTDIDLYEVIDIIERTVPERPDISTYNISLGPRGPIRDDEISRFTFALDLLAQRHKVGFMIAAGNDGDVKGFSRIQSPSDLVHGCGVGAFAEPKTSRLRAKYSCHGPGREGAKVKPDFLAFGGCQQKPFHLFSPSGLRTFAQGTSFATPLASQLHALVRGRFERSTSLLARTLMVHVSQFPKSASESEYGFGFLPNNWDEVLYNRDGAVTVVFQGSLIPKTSSRLIIPLPDDISLVGKTTLSWTVGALCPVDASHPGDYTTCCIQDTFYPHSSKNTYSPPKGAPKNLRPKVLHRINNASEIANLTSQGWKASPLPASKSPIPKSEQELRSSDLKWDTLVKKSMSLEPGSLSEPTLVLQAIPRRDFTAPFEYAAAVTIHSPKYAGDLYSEVIRRFPVLQPIRVRFDAEVMIPIQDEGDR